MQPRTDTMLAKIDRDEEGFFLDPSDWTPELIAPLCDEADIGASEEVLRVVWFVREYYERNQTVPEARLVLRSLRDTLGAERATRRYLQSLFPYGYGQQACKIAGMRKLRKLMLGV